LLNNISEKIINKRWKINFSGESLLYEQISYPEAIAGPAVDYMEADRFAAESRIYPCYFKCAKRRLAWGLNYVLTQKEKNANMHWV